MDFPLEAIKYFYNLIRGNEKFELKKLLETLSALTGWAASKIGGVSAQSVEDAADVARIQEMPVDQVLLAIMTKEDPTAEAGGVEAQSFLANFATERLISLILPILLKRAEEWLSKQG